MPKPEDPAPPDGGLPPGNPAPPTSGEQKPPDGTPEPLVNFREIVELRKEQRQTRDALKANSELLQQLLQGNNPQEEPEETAPAPTTDSGAQALAEVARMRAENAYYRTMAQIGGKLTQKQQAFLETSFQSANVPADKVAEWVTAAVEVFGDGQTPESADPPAAVVSTSANAPEQRPPASNTGAPGSNPVIPDGIFGLTGEQARSMDPAELRRRYNFERRAAGALNPFADAKR